MRDVRVDLHPPSQKEKIQNLGVDQHKPQDNSESGFDICGFEILPWFKRLTGVMAVFRDGANHLETMPLSRRTFFTGWMELVWELMVLICNLPCGR
jgi:hypothetical protein